MFDNDFRTNNGEPYTKKFITILCNYHTAMTETLGLMQKLLELQPQIWVVVPATLGSPLVVITKVGESSATPWTTEFRVPKSMV